MDWKGLASFLLITFGITCTIEGPVLSAQRFGVWVLLFPNTHPLLGGFAGALGIGIC